MTAIRFLPEADADIARLVEFLERDQPAHAARTVGLIVGAVDVLVGHPLIGRPVGATLRELVISRGRSGYLALYAYRVELDLVEVLAIRHQREAGYPQ